MPQERLSAVKKAEAAKLEEARGKLMEAQKAQAEYEALAAEAAKLENQIKKNLEEEQSHKAQREELLRQRDELLRHKQRAVDNDNFEEAAKARDALKNLDERLQAMARGTTAVVSPASWTTATADVAMPTTTAIPTTTWHTGMPWSFSYVNISVEERRCPDRCDPDEAVSCARCIRIGNGMRGPGADHSRIVEVTNVYYDQGAWFYGDEDTQNMVIKCGHACKPTWKADQASTWPGDGFDWHQYHHQSLGRDRPEFTCNASNTNMEPFLVVRWFAPHWTINPYHFYTDTTLSAFMTAAYISKVLGCKTRLKAYITAGLLGVPIFPDIWNLFFEQIEGVDMPLGCYRHVFYGQLYNNVPQVNWRSYIYDATLSSWMRAYSLDLRAGLLPAELLKGPVGYPAVSRLLFVDHPRAPDWWYKIDWAIPGVEIEPVSFEGLPYTEQISLVATSRGLLGIAGSGMQQQLFLPPRSLIGYVAVFEAQSLDWDHGCCASRLSRTINWAQPEENALNYINSAINLGNVGLMWRWCRPSIYNESGSAAFTSRDAKAVLKLLMSLYESSRTSPDVLGCVVLGSDPSIPGWPQCDQIMKVPYPAVTEECEAYGHVGLPYNLHDGSSYMMNDSRQVMKPYCGGHRTGRKDNCTQVIWYNDGCR